jgi:hypothetical protein
VIGNDFSVIQALRIDAEQQIDAMSSPLSNLAARRGAGYPSGGIVGRAALAVSRPLPSLRPDSQASMAAGGPVTSTGGLVPMCSMP